MWPFCGLHLANPLLDIGQVCRQFDTSSTRECRFVSFLWFYCTVQTEDIYFRPILCQNAPPPRVYKYGPQPARTGIEKYWPAVPDRMIGCAGGQTRLWKAKSRPSLHELPRWRNAFDSKLRVVQCILFFLVLTHAGNEQLNFTTIAPT
jgi:hypothetical protein